MLFSQGVRHVTFGVQGSEKSLLHFPESASGTVLLPLFLRHEVQITGADKGLYTGPAGPPVEILGVLGTPKNPDGSQVAPGISS